jgi:hypothetical protein
MGSFLMQVENGRGAGVEMDRFKIGLTFQFNMLFRIAVELRGQMWFDFGFRRLVRYNGRQRRYLRLRSCGISGYVGRRQFGFD